MRFSKDDTITQFVNDNLNKHFCNCGCGQIIQIKRRHCRIGVPKYLWGHGNEVSEITEWVRANIGKYLCQCGCGEYVRIDRSLFHEGIPKFIKGHQNRLQKNPPQVCQQCGKLARRKPSLINGRFYCSRKCFSEMMNTKEAKAQHAYYGALVSEEGRKEWRKKFVDTKIRLVKEGKWKAYKNCEPTDVSQCKYQGCNKTKFSKWNYCWEHTIVTGEHKIIGSAREAIRSVLRKAGLKYGNSGMPIEILFTMIIWYKKKGELNGCRDYSERN